MSLTPEREAQTRDYLARDSFDGQSWVYIRAFQDLRAVTRDLLAALDSERARGERLAEALGEIKYGLWGDMTTAGIVASMKAIAELALSEELGE